MLISFSSLQVIVDQMFTYTMPF